MLWAAVAGFAAGFCIFMVVYWCKKSHQAHLHCRRSAIRSSIRRASLYLSNTSPLELSVAELLFNLTGAATNQPDQPQTASSTLNKQIYFSSPTTHNVISTYFGTPPSYLSPPPPSHQGHQPGRRKPRSANQSTTEKEGKVKRKMETVAPGKSYEGPSGKYQSGKEVVTVIPRVSSYGNTVPKQRSRKSIGKLERITRKPKDHATIHRTDIEKLKHSSRGKQDPHFPSHPTGQSSTSCHIPCPLSLPDPPAESPTVFASFLSTVVTPPKHEIISASLTNSLSSRSRRVSIGVQKSSW